MFFMFKIVKLIIYIVFFLFFVLMIDFGIGRFEIDLKRSFESEEIW